MELFWKKFWFSVLLTLPLVGAFYLVYGWMDTPYPPFDVMKFVTKDVLSGGIVTFGIDTMTDVILETNPNADLDSAAKTSERMIAIVQFIGLAGIIGGLYGVVAEKLHQRGQFFSTEWSTGLILGMVTGALLAAISLTYEEGATAFPAFSSTWIIVAMLAWGGAHNWLYRRLLDDSTAMVDSPMMATAIIDSPMMMEGMASPSHVTPLDRRQFLIQLGAGSAVITVVGAGLGELLRTKEVIQGGNLEIAALKVGLEPAYGTRAEYTPLANHYRIDINVGDPPDVDVATYRLKIRGLVEQPLDLALDNIMAYPPVNQFVTLSCISNRVGGRLISTTQWTGVPMKQLLADWKPTPAATHIKITSFDGFDEIIDIATIMQDERVMLAYQWDGVPLLPKHGFPLRIYIPDHYGMKQPKWIEQMEFTNQWEEGYWVRRGWSRDAFVKTTSVIDTVAIENRTESNGQTLIPIGGIAYSGAKGISRVEVRVDDGDWLTADLRAPLSDTTWVLWRLDWPFEEGEHTFTVRAYDASGEAQIEKNADVRPDGATGYHRLKAG